VTNTLLDIGIQTEGMTPDRATDLMMKTAFQQEREAAGKWVRASLSSVQLLSYFTGYEEHRELRAEAQRRWGAKFDLRKYNDAVLAHGSPPVKYVRELLFDLPVVKYRPVAQARLRMATAAHIRYVGSHAIRRGRRPLDPDSPA
jgi:hypothetical protein